VVKKIKLTQGKESIVDDDNYEMLMKFAPAKFKRNREKGHGWYASKQHKSSTGLFYAATNVWVPELGRQRTVFMHKVILNPPKGKFTDHVNGDGLDNRKENLRVCTTAQNNANRGKNCTNTVGYKGVTTAKGREHVNKKYKAVLRTGNKAHFLGNYMTKEEAALAYDTKAKEVYGKFARLNFPNGPSDEVKKIIQETVYRPDKRKNNTTGFRGVGRNQWTNKNRPPTIRYCARIGHNGKYERIGYYETAEQAARAYDKKAVELWGEFAHLNFPEEK